MREEGVFRLIAHVDDKDGGEAGGGAEGGATTDEADIDALMLARTGIEFGAHDVTWTSKFSLSQGVRLPPNSSLST